jgi:hypothetical protein
MSRRLASLFRDRKFLLFLVFCAVLTCMVAIAVFRPSGREVPRPIDPTVPFDLRFPVPFEQRFPAESGPEPRPSWANDPIGHVRATAPAAAPAPATSINPATLRRVMDLGVAQFATGADDAAKTKGASLVLLSALLGFPPARELVVRNYPLSSAVRSAVPVQDVVRFAVDLLAVDAMPGEPAKLAIALGNYFARRGEVLIFAKHLVDAISDDDRTQTDEQISRLFSVFVRVPGVCTGIKRAISQDRTIDQNECSDDLRAELLRNARSRGRIGMEVEGRNRGLQTLNGLGIGK